MRIPWIVAPLALLGVFLAMLLGGAPPARAGDLDAIEDLLKSDKFEQRIEGLKQLAAGEASTRAETLALRALEDDDWGVQLQAIAALAKVGKEPARKALVRHTYEGEVQRVRDAAIEALKSMDRPRSVARLAKLASRAKDRAKVHMLEAAGRLAAPDDLKKLRRFVKDKDPRGAAAGVRALGHLIVHAEVQEDVIKSLEGALKWRGDHDDYLGYVAAIEACGRVDLPVTRDLLLDELMKQEDDDLHSQERIARALATMSGLEEAVRAVLGRAKDPEQVRRFARLVGRLKLKGLRPELEALLEHRYVRAQSEAARSLGLLADADAVPALTKALAGGAGWRVEIELVTALARLLEPEAFRALGPQLAKAKSFMTRLQFVVELDDAGDPAGIPALVPYTQDDYWEVATAALASIGTLGIAADMDLVKPALESKDWKLRGAAYEALGRLRAGAAVPLLIAGLEDKDPVVRGVCQGNLQILCERNYGTDTKRWLAWWERDGKDRKIVKRSRRSKEEIRKEEEEKKKEGRYAEPTRRYSEQRKREIEIMQKARILVVKGAWDHVEVVLKHLKIKHTALRAQELKDVGLNPNQIVLVNCEGTMDKRTRERVRWFVNVGGYLMSTDWALTKAVGQTFPGYLKQSSKANTGNDVVVVEEASPGHPLTGGVFQDVAALKWWLEIQAFPIQVDWPERCEVLVDSRWMRQRYGTSPMAAVFRHGLGKVQHSVSHFYLQEEAMQDVREPRARMIFALDHLGLSLEQVRRMASYGQFTGNITEATMEEIAPDYSMFRMIVNMVREKAAWVEGL